MDVRVSVKQLLVAIACLSLLACSKPSQQDGPLSAGQHPEFLAWVEHAVASANDEPSRATAQRLPHIAAALSNLDRQVLEQELDVDFKPHNPMLEDGREGLLKVAGAGSAPRGGAPNLLAGTAHILVEGELALIHRVGRMGPLQSINFDLLRFAENGRLAEHWSFLQPMEAGFLDNMLFSLVVPRPLDLIPTANSGSTDLWSDLPPYSAKIRQTGAQVQLNKLLVAEYLDQLYAGADVDWLVERFLAENYTLHVSGIEPGREAYRMVLSRAIRRKDAARQEISLAQNDLVWVLSRMQEIREADVPEVASTDLFRVRDGQIVEQWRVVQPSPRFSRNQNGLF
ncbi:MAG: nuclear transport factor 2 family protein [Gammaproteobacteria bacterium]|nr:nuclear transport factor 2 family protein [Gammaproteobacteria bacterium]